jgi:hypothetical protein
MVSRCGGLVVNVLAAIAEVANSGTPVGLAALGLAALGLAALGLAALGLVGVSASAARRCHVSRGQEAASW